MKTRSMLCLLHVVEKTDNRSTRLSGVDMEQVHLIALCKMEFACTLPRQSKAKAEIQDIMLVA